MFNSIVKERTRLGLSQSQLAERLGKSTMAVEKWEYDPSQIDGTTLRELSDFFGCSIDYLLGLTDKRVPTE